MKIVLPGEPLLDGPTALRPWRDSDLPAIVAACQDPEILRWTPMPQPYGDADARRFLLARHDMVGAGAGAPFAIVSVGDRARLLGSVSLFDVAWPHLRAKVGYWVAREARGQGHATRALQLICTWGFRSLGLERIELRAAVGNPASHAVAERAGFTREAVQRAYLRIKGRQLNMVAFGLLAADAG